MILNRARALRLQAKLPANLWPELMRTAAHIMNRSPARSLGWKTPFELLYNALGQPKKPDISYFQVIGSKAYVRIPKIPRLQKMEPKAFIGYLLGFESSNSFRIWVPQKHRVIVSRDVTFDEDSRFDPEDEQPQLSEDVIELIENPELDQDIEPTVTQTIFNLETPLVHQEIELQGIQGQQKATEHKKVHWEDSGLLTPSTDASRSRYITPEEETLPSPDSQTIRTARPQQVVAPRNISSNISESNIIPGQRGR